MTKEEYMRLTTYTSVDQARQDLQRTQALLLALLIIALISQYVVSFAADVNAFLAAGLLVADLLFFGYIVMHCHTLIKKTEQVSLAQIGFALIFLLGSAAAPFALVLAPMAYIWFVMPMLEPLEIIVGTRKPPDSLHLIEQKKSSRKQINERTWQTILVISLAVGFLMAALAYIEFQK